MVLGDDKFETKIIKSNWNISETEYNTYVRVPFVKHINFYDFDLCEILIKINLYLKPIGPHLRYTAKIITRGILNSTSGKSHKFIR